MEKTKNEYVVIKIPKDLATPVDDLIGKFGFRTRAEITKEALRALLLRYQDLAQGR